MSEKITPETLNEDNKIAVIKTGGKQYLVKIGQTLVVEKITVSEEEKDQTIVFDDILNSQKVTAKIIVQKKGKKVVNFQFRHKTGYQKTKGHRQNLTQIQILDIK